MGLTRERSSDASQLHAFIPQKLFFLFLLLQVAFFAAQAEAVDNTTTFLPLKVNSPQEKTAELTRLADAGLSEALKAHNLKMVDRAGAEKMVHYDGSWPPAAKDLRRIAEVSRTNNVAAGTLTVLGNQISIDFKIFDLLSLNSPVYYTRLAKSSADLPESLKEIVKDMVANTGRDSAGRDFTIASITPEGNKNIDSGAILRKIKSKAGDVYDPSVLREDLKAIFQMGYFDDVQVDVKDTPKGKSVIFKIVEKPVISSLTYKGIKELDEKDVKEAANIKEQSILNPSKLNNSVESIKTYYRSKGYYNTKVTPEISYPAPQSAEVVFAIDEGKKIYIKEIRFRGNTTFKSSELQDVMKTSTKWIFSWITEAGLLDKDQLKQDSDSIVAFYNNNGFLEAKISDPIVTQDEEYLYVTFDVDEGTRYTVGTIDFDGDLITDKQTLADMMSIRNEKFLSRKVLRENILKIQDFYGEKGYAFVDIRPDLKKSVDEKRFDIMLNIKKGDLVYINRIVIKGNSRTRDNVIRRELKVAEGGVFDSKALRTSSEKLKRLEYFEEVTLTPEPAGDPAKMNLDIDVKEKSTGRFSVGVGYSSVDQVVLMGQISEDNFLGLGDRLVFMANTGSSSRQFNLSFTNPHVNDSALSLRTDLFNLRRDYTSYTTDTKGGSLALGYPLWKEWMGIGSYRLTDTHLTNVTTAAPLVIRESQDLRWTSAVSYALKRDVRDRIYNPTKGSNNTITAQYAGGPLGGDSQFTKLEGETSWYFPLFMETVFHIRGSAGQAWENEAGKLPVYERYFLGGINTVRGFKYAYISPYAYDNVTGQPQRIGGDKMWFTNTEFLFPLVPSQGVQGLVFYDMGRVFNNDENWSFSDFRKSVGLGINWFSPLGPLRLVWGVNLDPQFMGLTGQKEAHSVWDFTMGGSF
jgi:outer membrane protein insertion porin family